MMEHIIYKITNILNNRFYIGMHSTDDINDGYLGSGKRIRAEIKNFVKENFVKEILEYLPSREALCERESQIVNEELMQDPLCLNLKNGGEGSWEIVHKTRANLTSTKFQEYKNSGRLAANFAKCREFRITSYSEVTKKNWQNHRETMVNAVQAGLVAMNTEAAKEKRKSTMKERRHAQGEKNSQFGSCWVTDGVKPIKIKKEQLEAYILQGYKRGRKV